MGNPAPDTTGGTSGNESGLDGNPNEIVGASSDGPSGDGSIAGGPSGNEGGTGGLAIEPETLAGSPAPKKRGRKAYPRDAAGNIIRSAASGQTKAQLAVGNFVANDRPKVRQQIQGMHAFVATLTNQPIFLLHDEEAFALTNALCEVLDYHQINLSGAGGPYGLYLALAITVFTVYKPRFDIIAQGNKVVGFAAQPTSEQEAREQLNTAGMMDFGANSKEA